VTGGRRLSSRLTFFYKVVLPAAWIGIFGAVTVTLFVAPVRGAGDVLTARWIMLAATAVGAVVFRLTCIPLKRVALGPSSFFVSNFREEIELPFAEVARISGSRFVNPPVIRLELRRPGRFGQRIVFAPPVRLLGFGEHPLARELRDIVTAGPG
jgi:hypothetical protein